tara:strand:+ start:365842 stop:366339 length:498 start_codon:yes stop_codon:yes gene_type:complete
MTTAPEIQVFTPFTSASSDLADAQRIHIGTGSPSSAVASQIQAVRLFATGVLAGAGATPTDATALVILKRDGLRLFETVATITTATSQTADTYAAADAEDDEAVCKVSLPENANGILDLLGATINQNVDHAGESGDDNNISWHIVVNSLGGYKSIQLYAAPARRV